MRRYVEVSSNGIDESLQGISSSPFVNGSPTSVGLRIPNPATPITDRFLFLLATRVVSKPTKIRGIRQMLTIGASLPRIPDDGSGTPIISPVELNVTTPSFRFLDGNVSWHLVREPNIRRRQGMSPLTDTTNFRFVDSDGPALLYQTFTAAAGTTNPSTGAPLFYANAIATYTPPAIWGDWIPLAEDLGTFGDLRFPWNATRVWGTVNIDVPVVSGQQRVSLYASVLQTSAAQRTIPNYPATFTTGMYIPPEWQFILTNFNLAAAAVPTFYWRIAGSLIFEDSGYGDSAIDGDTGGSDG